MTHLTGSQYKTLGAELITACDGKIRVFEHPVDDCWLMNQPGVPVKVAAPVPADRYSSEAVNFLSNVIQHNRTTWALKMMEEDPDVEVAVWMDYGITKQGYWNGNPIKPEHIWNFLRAVERYDFVDMPFPGIERMQPINPHGNNWRFCGSTHIWPRAWLPQIDAVYKEALMRFIKEWKAVPLDLAIWPTVEEVCLRERLVPFTWYKAEYDNTQLTNFPGYTHA